MFSELHNDEGVARNAVSPSVSAEAARTRDLAIQNEGVENLVRGSPITMEDVPRRAPGNGCLEAPEVKARGIVDDVL